MTECDAHGTQNVGREIDCAGQETFVSARDHSASHLARGGGSPRWGNLRRLTPFSENWGSDRGTAISRYYLHRFLTQHAHQITGDVLEIQGTAFTRRFGSQVRTSHSIDLFPQFKPTYLCDLAAADIIPSNMYDCFLLPNTLHGLRDIRGCMRHMLRVLKPGGVILATASLFEPLMPLETPYPDCWRLTAAGWSELAAELWPGHDCEIDGYGNCLAAVAALYGLAYEELTTSELEYQDDRYPIAVTIVCRKRSASA